MVEKTKQEQTRLPASAATVSEGPMKAIRSERLCPVKLGNGKIVKEYKREAIAKGLPAIVEESVENLQSDARSYRRKVAASESDLQDLTDSLTALRANVPSMLTEPLKEGGCGVWVADNVVPLMLRDLLETSLDAIAEILENRTARYRISLNPLSSLTSKAKAYSESTNPSSLRKTLNSSIGVDRMMTRSTSGSLPSSMWTRADLRKSGRTSTISRGALIKSFTRQSSSSSEYFCPCLRSFSRPDKTFVPEKSR